jgi:flagellar biosynthesis regulator FlbT
MKTAVELYNQEIKELFNQFQDGEISNNMFHMQRLVALTKAKELEKQQIMKAVYDSMGTNLDPNMGRAEQYYNETYNNK